MGGTESGVGWGAVAGAFWPVVHPLLSCSGKRWCKESPRKSLGWRGDSAADWLCDLEHFAPRLWASGDQAGSRQG